MGPTLAAEYPHLIKRVTRLFNFQSPSLAVSYGQKKFNEQRFFFADSSFLQLFGFQLIEGEASKALSRPGSVIITPSTAKRYFGNSKAMGKRLIFRDKFTLEVTGIVAEPPRRSHIDFDFIASFSTLEQMPVKAAFENWIWNPCWTYVLLDPEASPEMVQNCFPDFVQKHFPGNLAPQVKLHLQPVRQIHLYSDLDYEISANGDVRYVYIFGGMAVFILLISVINFTNLSTAMASARVRSVVIIKAMGISRGELFYFHLLEAALMSSFAILVGFVMVEIVSPFLTDLSGNPLQGSVLSEKNMLAGIFLAGICAGIISGIYPAYYLASFEIGNFYQGHLQQLHLGKRFRNLLLIVQFSISMLFFIAMLVSGKQLDFLQNAKLGFDKEQVVVVPVAGSRIVQVYPEFKEKLQRHEAIASVTAMEEVLGKSYQTHEFYSQEKGNQFYPSIVVGHDFIRTFNIEILVGRDFISRSGKPSSSENDFGVVEDMFNYFDEDEHNAVIINQAMVEYMGWGNPLNAIGKTLSRKTGNEKVVGVVKNFHFSSLHKQVAPFVIDLAGDNIHRTYIKYVAVKIKPDQIAAGLKAIHQVWNALNPSQPPDIFFLKEKLDKLYIKEERFKQLSTWLTAIAVLLACIGLFGISSFVIQQRRREIGIRKAIGAYDYQLVGQIVFEFLATIAISIFITAPIGYLLMSNWLNMFPYRISLTADIFLIAGGIIILVSALAVVHNAFQVTRFTPMETLAQGW